MPAVRDHKLIDGLEHISPGVITAGCDERNGEVTNSLPRCGFNGDTIIIGGPRVNRKGIRPLGCHDVMVIVWDEFGLDELRMGKANRANMKSGGSTGIRLELPEARGFRIFFWWQGFIYLRLAVCGNRTRDVRKLMRGWRRWLREQ